MKFRFWFSNHLFENVNENFRFHKHFRENQTCRENIGTFSKILTKMFVFVNIFAKIYSKIWNFFPRENLCLPNIIMSWLCCPGYLSGRLFQSDLFRLSCPSCPVTYVLSKKSLTRLSCPDSSVLS
jgi:hypothetical protein